LEETISNLSGTVSPWLMGTFFMLGLVVSVAAGKNWRDMKRSPYYFQRLQAGKRLQTYLSASFVLFLTAMVVGLYSWQAPEDTTMRRAIISNGKPVPVQETAEQIELSPVLESVEESSSDEFQLEPSAGSARVIPVADQTLESEQLSLPDAYDRLEPRVELNEDSNLSTLSFSTEVDDEYNAVEPRQIFAEGFYTLYATFEYDGLEDGMVWSWVWRRDGEIVEGGNELWSYGEEGPGYIFFNPEQGFKAGQYSLDVWVNGELMTQSAVIMNSASISANN
jgi:hypothetical protein